MVCCIQTPLCNPNLTNCASGVFGMGVWMVALLCSSSNFFRSNAISAASWGSEPRTSKRRGKRRGDVTKYQSQPPPAPQIDTSTPPPPPKLIPLPTKIVIMYININDQPTATRLCFVHSITMVTNCTSIFVVMHITMKLLCPLLGQWKICTHM